MCSPSGSDGEEDCDSDVDNSQHHNQVPEDEGMSNKTDSEQDERIDTAVDRGANMLMENSDGVPCEAMSTDTTTLLILDDSVSLIQLVNCGTY